MGSHHPERPARIAAIEDHLLATGILEHLVDVSAPPATREQLLRVHDPDYLDAIEASVPERGLVHLDPGYRDEPAFAIMPPCGRQGRWSRPTDMVVGNEVENAFCCVRPPGHHATRARAMGFCFFNNVAVGAAHAMEAHGLERVAIVDFDVHHGNGTEDIFSDDPRVMMVSTFQHPFYPYSGMEGRSDRMVNVPLAAYSGGRQFREAVEKFWIPALERFRPQMVFISAGFDAHRDDDMASLGLVESDYAWVTERLVAYADRFCRGRIVSSLEGGYDLDALARSVAVHLRALARL